VQNSFLCEKKPIRRSLKANNRSAVALPPPVYPTRFYLANLKTNNEKPIA